MQTIKRDVPNGKIEGTCDERFLAHQPFASAYGLTGLLHLAVYLGATLVLLPDNDVAQLLRTVRRTRPTYFPTTPRMVRHLTHTPGVRGFGFFSGRVKKFTTPDLKVPQIGWNSLDLTPHPLWQGLPADSKLRPHDLDERINTCTGIDLPEAARSPAQKRALANILAVVHIPERTLASNMNWA